MGRILIVETDRVLAINVCNFLAHDGHQVDWQYDLQAAIDSADNAQPDLVLLELLLCNRGGVEFLYEFRSYPDWQDIPVVIFSNISPRDLGGSTRGLKQLNISAYHYKPTTPLPKLAETVDFLLASVRI